MKAVQIVSPNNLQIIDVEKPSIDEKNNVMIKMTAAGICGTEDNFSPQDNFLYHNAAKEMWL